MTRKLTLTLICLIGAMTGNLRAEDIVEKAVSTEVLLLDRMLGDQRRPARFPTGEAGSVMIEHPDMPADGWRQMQWLVRFPLERLTAEIRSATLVLWANSRVGDTHAALKVTALTGGQGTPLREEELGDPLVEEPLEIVFPKEPGRVRLDVTEMLEAARSAGLAYAVFRISAASEELLDGRTPGRFFFGGLENNYQWPEWEPPMLEVEVD